VEEKNFLFFPGIELQISLRTDYAIRTPRYIKCLVELHTFLFVNPDDLFEVLAVLYTLVVGKFAYIFGSLLPCLSIHVD
jgi:hypothetical protein